jgi:hypothetical protein
VGRFTDYQVANIRTVAKNRSQQRLTFCRAGEPGFVGLTPQGCETIQLNLRLSQIIGLWQLCGIDRERHRNMNRLRRGRTLRHAATAVKPRACLSLPGLSLQDLSLRGAQ